MKLQTLLCVATVFLGSNASFAQEPESGPEAVANEPLVGSTNAAVEAVPEEPVHTRSDSAVVSIGRDARLKAGHRADAVVAIGGSAYAAGPVRDAVVAIMGDSYASNDVGNAVVAVLGNARAQGNVGEAVVAVLGNAHADGEVRDAVVAVLGNVTLGSNAIVHRDVVAIGGTVTVPEGAEVRGQIQEIAFAIPGLPDVRELPVWIRECVFKLRPLTLAVLWPWLVAGAFLLVYLLVAVAFPRPVEICRSEISQRPATTFFVGLLTKILLPVLALVLAATGIGLLALPFVFVAVFFAAILGKVAMLQFIGGALTRAFGVNGAAANLLALLIGSAIALGLYLIPVVGFVAYVVLGTWALGAAVTALFNYMSREKPQPPLVPPPGGYSGPGGSGPAAPPVNPSVPPGSTTPPVAPSAFAYPRAGFWERMGAAFLDLALLAIVFAVVGPFVIVVGLAYFAGMWTWKGTTVGGLILRHQLVRYNGQPVTFPVALVRAVAAMFSAAVLFLGFFWIGWNRDKQGWHDLIAGTCVVRLPQAMPLVCL